MSSPSPARAWHLVTAVVTWIALVLQLVLVIAGGTVLDETNPPDLATRIVRFFSYFTVLSNLLVALTTTTLVLGQDRYPRWWRVLRLNGVVCIAVTGVVHWFFLRPLLTLSGADWVADKLLHVVVPLLAVAGWAAFGPRGRADATLLLPSLAFPLAWLTYTFARGAATDWYPYPFLNAGTLGYPRALLACAGVAVLLLALTWLAIRLDPRLPGVSAVARSPRPRRPVPR